MLHHFQVYLVALFCFALIHCTVNAQSKNELRILSYNIHHAEGVDGKLDLARIAKAIQSTNPDIVSLQEVDRNVARSGHVDQPAELARMLEMTPIFDKNIDVQGGEYGNAVLTKLHVIEYHNERLPNTDNGELRGVLSVRLKLEGHAIPLTFMSTHLDHRASPVDRIESVKKINELAVNLKGPSILAGDLNTGPDTEPVRILLDKWTNTSVNVTPTFPAGMPSIQIDYILYNVKSSDGYAWKILESKVIEEKVASDHRPIFSRIQLLVP